MSEHQKKPTLIILDRDGTLNEMVVNADHGIIDSPLHPSQVSLIPGVVEALQRLKTMGCSFAIATNQPAAAKGKTTLENLKAVHEKVIAELKAGGIGGPMIGAHNGNFACFERLAQTIEHLGLKFRQFIEK